MKINFNPISFSQNINQKNYTNHTNKLERMPYHDCVSFSGKKTHQKTLKPNVQAAVDFSKELIEQTKAKQITFKDVSDIAAKYSDDITVLPMERLKEKTEAADMYGAFFTTQIGDDFKPYEKSIYINLPKQNSDKTEIMLFAMNTAHEFTHAKQIDTNKSFDFLKTISKGNPEYGKALACIGDAAFAAFDNQIQAHVVSSTIRRYINPTEFLKYGCITPSEAPITRQMLPLGMGVRSEKEMQQELRNIYDGMFTGLIQAIAQQRPEIIEAVPDNEDLDSLKKKIKGYIAIKAMDEREAYTTESEVAKREMKTTKTLNIDAFPMYYDILAKAFE